MHTLTELATANDIVNTGFITAFIQRIIGVVILAGVVFALIVAFKRKIGNVLTILAGVFVCVIIGSMGTVMTLGVGDDIVKALFG